MKVQVDLNELTSNELCDKTICLRIPLKDFERIKKIDKNISLVVRNLITTFLDQVAHEKRRSSWMKKD